MEKFCVPSTIESSERKLSWVGLNTCQNGGPIMRPSGRDKVKRLSQVENITINSNNKKDSTNNETKMPAGSRFCAGASWSVCFEAFNFNCARRRAGAAWVLCFSLFLAHMIRAARTGSLGLSRAFAAGSSESMEQESGRTDRHKSEIERTRKRKLLVKGRKEGRNNDDGNDSSSRSNNNKASLLFRPLSFIPASVWWRWQLLKTLVAQTGLFYCFYSRFFSIQIHKFCLFANCKSREIEREGERYNERRCFERLASIEKLFRKEDE